MHKTKKQKMFDKIRYLPALLLIVTITFSSCSVTKDNRKSGSNTDKVDNRTDLFNFNLHFLEGSKQKVLGNYEVALNSFNNALKIDGKQSAVYFEIAGILLLMQDYSSSQEYAQRAVEFDRTDNEYYKLMLALTYQSNNLLAKSAEVYQTLIKSHPEKIQYYFELSNLYVLTKREKDAIKILNDAEKRFGIVDVISVEKEKIYLLIKDYQNATNEIKKLAEEYPENIKYKTILAETYVNTGKIEEAGKLYSEIEKSEIEEGLLYFSIADFYLITKDQDKFFMNLSKGFAAQNVPIEVKMRVLLGLMEKMEANKKNLDDIKKLLDILAELYPEDVTVKALYSDYYIFVGDFKSAQKELDYILENDKNKYQVWSQALYVDYALNDMQKMYQRGKEAVELYPNVLEFYKYYIIAAYFTEHFDEVIESVDYASPLAVTDQPLLLDFLSLQGDAYHKLNKNNESDSVYELILEKDRDYVSVLNNYSYFLAQRGEKLDRALELSTRLVNLESKQPAYIDTHAWVLFKNGNYEEALKFIDVAISLDPNNAVYYEHKGDILYKLDKKEEALKMWEKAAKTGKGSDLLKDKIEMKKIIE